MISPVPSTSGKAATASNTNAGVVVARRISVTRGPTAGGVVVANPPCYISNTFLGRMTEGQRLPLSEELGQRLMCVSVHPKITTADNEYIAAALWDAVERVREEG